MSERLQELLEQAKADGNPAQIKRIEFLLEHGFDSNKDYSSDFQALFGSDRTNVGINYTGPNPSWQSALQERLANRSRGGADHATGFYEGSTANMDQDLRAKMFRRNNAIEDMFRRGYSLDQIRAHTSGQRNVLEEGPSWQNYGSISFGSNVIELPDNYFRGVPQSVSSQSQQPSFEEWLNSPAGEQYQYSSIIGETAAKAAYEAFVRGQSNTVSETNNTTYPGIGAGAGGGAGFESWKSSLPSSMANLNDDTLRGIWSVISGVNPTGIGASGVNLNNLGGRGGAGTGRQQLPSYMSINDAGKVVFAEGTTNRQFVEGLNLLGLLDGDHPAGSDYDWLIQWFDDTGGGGGSDSWLNVFLSDPDRTLDYEADYASTDLTSANKTTLRRLYDLVNNASTEGGFTPSQGFLNTYTDPGTVGEGYGSETASRPVFIGQPPTGGTAERPYYSVDDVLVTAFEQPNLYDVFDPYPAGGFPTVDPYSRPVTTRYPYTPPEPTPGLVFGTQGADPVTDFVAPPQTIPTQTGTGGTGITFTGAGTTTTPTTTTPTITTPTTTTPTATTPTTTTPTATTPTATTPTTTTPTAPDTSGYVSFAKAQGVDDYLYDQRDVGYRGDIQALLGSRQDLTADEFNALLAQQAGRYGEGSTLAYDPRFGVYSTIGEDELARYRAGERGIGYEGLDPTLMSDADRIRNNMVSGTDSLTYTDEEGRVFRVNRDRQRLRVGDKQYIMNPDGSVTSYTVRDTPRDDAPDFSPSPSTGFAEGGIVSIAGDFSNMEMTGDGIESFLNPERSKATLRRNLAKLAPRPTAPAPTMQQGIMPMAR